MIGYYLENINFSTDLIYIAIRTCIIYFYAVFLLRYGNSRLNFKTSVDFVFIITIGSVLARAINGSSTLLAAVTGTSILVGLHWLLALACYHFPRLGNLIKGNYSVLIKNGQIIRETMKKNSITEDDVMEIVREKLHSANLNNINEARIERTGRVTFIIKDHNQNPVKPE